MQLIEAKAKNTRGFFYVPIIFGKNALTLKYDTGASKSVISGELIFGEITDKQRIKVHDYCSEKVLSETFSSASGHQFIAYPFVFNNVIIGKTEIPLFFCYIIIDKLFDDRKIALLGKDFIDCCSFTHDYNSDILISEFDESGYEALKNTICVDEVIDLVR